jgi:hypothetical protein
MKMFLALALAALKPAGKLSLMTLICVAVWLLFMAVRPAPAREVGGRELLTWRCDTLQVSIFRSPDGEQGVLIQGPDKNPRFMRNLRLTPIGNGWPIPSPSLNGKRCKLVYSVCDEEDVKCE